MLVYSFSLQRSAVVSLRHPLPLPPAPLPKTVSKFGRLFSSRGWTAAVPCLRTKKRAEKRVGSTFLHVFDPIFPIAAG